MTPRTVTLEADLATVSDAVNIGARTVVALPPSDLDPAADEMRCFASGLPFIREYDPELEQP